MTEYLGPYQLGPAGPNVGIYYGDARELSKAIPDESIDLIFTDPIYQRIDDYRWLAETAARVLKDGGNLVSFVSPNNQVEIANIFTIKGFVWCDYLVLRETARRRYNHGRKIVGLYEVAAWASKGQHRLGKYVKNFSFVSNGYIKTDTFHDWEKPLEGITHWVERLSTDLVFDPFCGGGSTLAACIKVGRKYLAFEIVKATCEVARQRVRDTQPPLTGLVMPEQLSLLNA